MTVSDTSATAATLNSVKAITSVAPVFTSVTAITASPASTIVTLFTGANATLGTETISVNDTSISASALNTIDGYTTGAVTTTATTITGAASDIETALQSAGIVHAADIAVTITDTNVGAEALNDVNDATTGVVTVQSTAITGTYTEVAASYAANAAGTIAGLGNEAVTLNDGAGGAASYTPQQIRLISASTTGAVTATCSSTDIAAILHADTGLSESGHNITVTVATASVTGAQLVSLDAKTDVQATINSTTVTGAVADILSAYGSSGLTGLGNEAITPTGPITVAQANSLSAHNYWSSYSDY